MTDTKELIKSARTIADSIHVHSSFQDWEAAEKDTLEKCADALETAEKRIAELEAQMPKEGKWTTKRTWEHDGEIYCSVCNHDAPTEGDYRQVKTNYCPNCGAKMEGKTGMIYVYVVMYAVNKNGGITFGYANVEMLKEISHHEDLKQIADSLSRENEVVILNYVLLRKEGRHE